MVLLALWIGAACILTMPGCAGRAAQKARANAPTLEIGRSVEGSIHCGKGRCDQWYRLVIGQRGTMRIEADAPADAALPDFGLTLFDSELTLIGDERVEQARPRRITKDLSPGLYFVQVWGLGENRDRVSYRIVAQPRKARTSRSRPVRKAAPPPAPKPAAPRQPMIVSEILEVERTGGEPTAVLLELGQMQGIEAGARGRLLNGDLEIGEIEVLDVYPEGSRARIVEGLSAPITAETRAELGGGP